MGNSLQKVTLSVMTLRNANFMDRIDAAADAGFGGIGLRLVDYEQAQQSGMSEQDIDNALEERNLQVPEIEFLRSWVGCEDDPAYLEEEERLFAMAGRLGAHHVNVGVFEKHPLERIAASFARLCDIASSFKNEGKSLLIGMEPMPYTPPVHSLSRGNKLIQMVHRDNAALVADSWQWFRADGSNEALKDIDPDAFSCIQLSDARPTPMQDVTEESRHHRCVPGEGGLDLLGFVEMLEAHGVDAPLSTETMSDELDAMPAADAALRVARGLERAMIARSS